MARDWEQVTGQPSAGGESGLSPRQRKLLRRGPRIRPPRSGPRTKSAARRQSGPRRAGSPAGRRVARHDARRASRRVGGTARLGYLALRPLRAVGRRPAAPLLAQAPRPGRGTGRAEGLAGGDLQRQPAVGSGRPLLARRASAGAARRRHPVRARLPHRPPRHGPARRRGSGLAAGVGGRLTRWPAFPASTWPPAPPAAPAPSPPPPQSPRRLTTARRSAVPGIRDTLFSGGRWLAPAASGWIEIPELERCGLPAPPLQFGQASADSEGRSARPVDHDLTRRAEQAALGAMIADRQVAARLGYLEPEDFTDPRRRWVFRTVRQLSVTLQTTPGNWRDLIAKTAGRSVTRNYLDELVAACPDPAPRPGLRRDARPGRRLPTGPRPRRPDGRPGRPAAAPKARRLSRASAPGASQAAGLGALLAEVARAVRGHTAVLAPAAHDPAAGGSPGAAPAEPAGPAPPPERGSAKSLSCRRCFRSTPRPGRSSATCPPPRSPAPRARRSSAPPAA